MPDDPHDEIVNGVAAAMELSYHKLMRIGFTPRQARAELLRLARLAVHQLGDGDGDGNGT